MNDTRFILTGPPGAGKTSVLGAMADCFYAVPEAARQVIAAQRARQEKHIGDRDPPRFVGEMYDQCLKDYTAAAAGKISIFDRALPDVAGYAMLFGLPTDRFMTASRRYRFATQVFWFPHWPEIYTVDEDRQATPAQIAEFSRRLKQVYEALDYQLVEVPRLPIDRRAAWIAEAIEG